MLWRPNTIFSALFLSTNIYIEDARADSVLFEMGLSISYNCVMSIQYSTILGNNLCHQFEMEKTVCPPKLKGKLFTTAAIDNIDHNPSSTTAQDSFHGTGISIFQHPRCGESRVDRRVNFNNSYIKVWKNCQSYSDIPPVTLSKKDPVPPKLRGSNKSDCQVLIPEAIQTEYRYASISIMHTGVHVPGSVMYVISNSNFYRWLDHVRKTIKMDKLVENENISWAAYHASHNQDTNADYGKSLSCLLPLFCEDSKSVAILCHEMDIVKEAVDNLNPGQVPIITADQPLYTFC